MKRILLLLIPLLLGGCYNYNEIEKTAIIDAISIDYENNQYNVTFEIIKNTDPDSLKLEATYITGNGHNIVEAFYNTETKIDTNPFFSHLELLILNQDVINNHFNDIIDYILRNPKINNNALLIGTTKSADILLRSNNHEEVTSNLIKSLINNNYNNDSIKTITFDDIVNKELSYGIDSIIPLVTISDSNTYEFDGMITINKPIIFNKKDVINYNILNNNCKNIILNYEDTTIKLLHSKTKIDFKNNIIKVNLDSELSSFNKDIAITQYETKLQKQLELFYQLLKTNNIDLLGINEFYYKKYHRQTNYFRNNNFNIVVNIKIKKYGLINEVKDEA